MSSRRDARELAGNSSGIERMVSGKYLSQSTAKVALPVSDTIWKERKEERRGHEAGVVAQEGEGGWVGSK